MSRLTNSMCSSAPFGQSNCDPNCSLSPGSRCGPRGLVWACRCDDREALKNFCARSQEDLKTCFSTPRSCRPRADSHLILSFTGQGYPWPVYWLQTDRHRFDQGQSATARRSILRHFICKRPDCAPAACSSPKERRVYGASSLILVAQFPRDVRVPPQEPIAPVRYSANVHV